MAIVKLCQNRTICICTLLCVQWYLLFALHIFRIRGIYSKRSQLWRPNVLKVKKEYKYKWHLQENVFAEKTIDVFSMRRSVPLPVNDPRNIAPSIAKVSRPDNKTLLSKHNSRFK